MTPISAVVARVIGEIRAHGRTGEDPAELERSKMGSEILDMDAILQELAAESLARGDCPAALAHNSTTTTSTETISPRLRDTSHHAASPIAKLRAAAGAASSPPMQTHFPPRCSMAAKSSDLERGESPPRLTTDRLLYNPDIEWLLCCSASANGERGTLAGVIGAIERGCSASGSSYQDPYTDEQIGLHKYGHIQRTRDLWGIWCLLSSPQQSVLGAYYSTAGMRATYLFGALGQFAGVALLLATETGEAGSVIQAPQSSSKPSTKLLASYRSKAEESTRDAHRAWLRARSAARRAVSRRTHPVAALTLEIFGGSLGE